MAHRPAAVAVLAAPLVFPQGGDFAVSWLWAEGDPAGAPAGWPGSWRGRMEVRDSFGGDVVARFHTSDVTDGVDGPLVLAAYSVGTPSTVTGVPDGGTAAQITLTVTAAVTSAWTWADQPRLKVFDVELWNPTSGRTVRFLEGTAALSREVTTGV